MLHARPGSRAAGRGFARACGSSPRARCALFLYRICKKKWSHKGLAVRAHVFSSPILPHPISRGVLAGLLQTSKWGKWSLQNFCKRQNGENGACRTSANAKMEKMALAGLLQTSKWGKWSLQNFCKRQNGESGACRTSANVKMGKMALAELLQTSKWRKWCLQNFCKRRLIHGYVTLNT